MPPRSKEATRTWSMWSKKARTKNSKYWLNCNLRFEFKHLQITFKPHLHNICNWTRVSLCFIRIIKVSFEL